MYSYTPGGLVTTKRLRIVRGALNPADLDAGYTYDNEGHTTAVTYPTSKAIILYQRSSDAGRGRGADLQLHV